MINDGVNNVPDNTIAVILGNKDNHKKMRNTLDKILTKPDKKRDWFSVHFYRCLPLAVANQYGYVVKSEFDFEVMWDGGEGKDAITFYFNKELKEINKLYPRVSSEFGHGVFTINPPWVLRTPPGVNLMTMNPPNYVLPNVTCMTGTIETDNIRRNFTFNMKIQIPNIKIRFPAGTPLAAFIPIPRYFPDKFELKIAEDIFDKEVMDEEYRVMEQIDNHRKTVEPTKPYGVGRLYFRGLDGDGNKFKDHQFPRPN
jgi:hypothetical protein